MDIGGGITTALTSGTATLTLGAGGTAGNAGQNTISGAISNGAGGVVAVTMNGASSVWVLSGSNTYSGTTSVSRGTLVISGNNSGASGGVTVSNGATLDINSATALGSGTFTIVNGSAIDNTSGGTITNAGNNAINASGASINFAGSNSLNLGTGNVTIGGTGTHATWAVNANTLTVGGNISGGQAIYKGGAGTLVFSGNNSGFTGGIDLGQGGATTAGTLDINSATALGTGTFQLDAGSGGIATIDNTSGTAIINSENNAQAWATSFTFNGSNNLNLGTGGVTLGVATVTVTTAAGVLTVGGTIGGPSAVGIIKGGAGTLVLTGSNGYTGTTTIKNGTLDAANSNGSATGSGGVTLTGSSALSNPTLAGSGFISGLVTTTGTGAAIGAAHLAPGLGPTPGTLTLGNGLTIGNGTNLDFDLGSTSSLIAVTGNLSLGGNVVLNPTGIAGFGLNTVYDLINFSGTLLNSGSLASWTASSLPGGATGYSFALVSGTEITVTFTGSGTTPAVAYWQGALSGTWATVTSGSTNFTSDAAGTTNTTVIPGSTTNVKFTANSAGNLGTVLGQDFTINSLEFTGTSTTAGTTSVTIGGTNTLTVMAGGTNGNTAGTGITVDAGSAAHTIGSNVALGSSQSWIVNGSALTVSGTVSDGGHGYGLTKSGTGTLVLSASETYTGATAVNAGALEVDGSLSGSSAVTVGVATLSGTGNIGGSVALTGTSNLSSAGTLTVASLGVSGLGNTISSGTVDATGGTTLNNGSGLAVNGTLGGGTVTTGSGSVLSGTGRITGGVTVSAGGVTSPGGAATGVLTSDLAYNASSTANFNVSSSGSAGTPQGHLSNLYYSQMIVTGGSGVVSLGIGTGVTLGANSATSLAQTASQIVSGTSNSGVTLQLSLSSADYATLLANKTTSYNAKAANSGLDNYFVFNLGTTLSTGRFTTLGLDVNGVNTTGIIYYSGAQDRFAADGVGNTIGDVIVGSQEFALSYTGNFGSNSTVGGNDIVLTAIPEPGTWGMIFGGFGMLMAFQRLRKRRWLYRGGAAYSTQGEAEGRGRQLMVRKGWWQKCMDSVYSLSFLSYYKF